MREHPADVPARDVGQPGVALLVEEERFAALPERLVHEAHILFDVPTSRAQDYELVKIAEILRSPDGKGGLLSKRYIPLSAPSTTGFDIFLKSRENFPPRCNSSRPEVHLLHYLKIASRAGSHVRPKVRHLTYRSSAGALAAGEKVYFGWLRPN